MTHHIQKTEQEIIEILNSGGVCVIPTDTLYGLVCKVQNKKSVERIYTLKKRTPTKPLLVLINSISDLIDFGVKPTQKETEILYKVWPNPITVTLNCTSQNFSYLYKSFGSIAFRIPKEQFLRKLLSETGPLCAPSANIEGLPPASTLEDAFKYFGEDVDGYLDGGLLGGEASTIFSLQGDSYFLIREGVIPKEKIEQLIGKSCNG